MKLVQKASQTVVTSSDINFKIESEVNTYIHLQITASEESPLAFWRKQEDNYPNLSILAKCYLSVSASSVPVEAMFSTCGLMLNSSEAPWLLIGPTWCLSYMTITQNFILHPVLLLLLYVQINRNSNTVKLSLSISTLLRLLCLLTVVSDSDRL